MKQATSALAVWLILANASQATGIAGETETADALFAAGKWEQAREAYEDVLPTLEGNDAAKVLRNIGYTWQRQDQHENAVSCFRQVLELDNIDPEHVSGALLRLGYSLRLLGEGEQAIQTLESAIDFEGAPVTHRAEALLYAAWEHNTRGEVDAALSKFERVGELEGVHANYIATAKLSIGRIHQDRKQYEQAVAVYREIADLNPVAAVNRSRARVYILECEALLAGDVPFHIKPYVTGVSADSALLLWVSQGEIPPGLVTVKPAAQQADSTKTESAALEATPEVFPLSDTICHLHQAVLTGLAPGTSYTYEVDCENQQLQGTFKTAPGAGEPFSFSLIGDTQSYHSGLQPLLDAMAADKTDFVLHVGDITDRGNLWGEWKGSFFDPGWGYLQDRVLWPVYGNHDGGPYFPALFDLRDHYWYSFDWGDAHFVILDSYGAGSGGRGREQQLAWLAEDLAQNDKPWTFIALHIPMMATRKSLKWFGDEDFLPLLEQHEVDIVFSGHHPHYRRYRPVGAPGKKPILHITSGGGGGPVGGSMPSPLLTEGIDVNHYCRIDVDQSRLTLTARSINGAEIDRFELSQEDSGHLAQEAVLTDEAKAVISLYEELLTDRTFELRLTCASRPEPEKPVELILDLSRLPRGPLDPQDFAADDILLIESSEESPWLIAPQSFHLRSGTFRIKATAPESLSISNDSVTPVAKVRLRLKKGGRKFEPVDAITRLRLSESDE